MINKETYQALKNELDPLKVKIVAVSKKQPLESIYELNKLGQRDFAENYAQDFASRVAQTSPELIWHFIGHLQTNKIRLVIPSAFLIHSVDSIHLLQAISKEAVKMNIVVNCLLQIHIAKEQSKYGFTERELKNALDQGEIQALPNLKIKGLMGMATFTDDHSLVSREFHCLRLLFEDIKWGFFPSCPDFTELSMGMTDDYKIAVSEGSTMVRIGTLLFGSR